MRMFRTNIGMFKYHCAIYTSVSFQQSIESILSSPKKTMVVFDLDNTLILTTPLRSSVKKSGFGGDIWFTGMLKQMQHHPDFPTLYMALISYYCAIQPHLRYTTTEDCVPNQLRTLRERNIPVLGLTARSASLAEITIKKTKELDIHFDEIIFCSGRKKSECFETATQTLPIKTLLTDVKQIAFIDDSEKHCKDMQEWIQKRYASHVTHYKYVEKKFPRQRKQKGMQINKKLSNKQD